MNTALNILLLLLSGALILSLLKNHHYNKILKSKKIYDDMTDLMEGERRLIKEDRIKITYENKACKRELDKLIAENNECYVTITRVSAQFDALASKYIKVRIDLLQMKLPNLKDSPSVLYKLQDLLNLKKNGSINTGNYLREVDKVFDGLADGTFK